MLRVFRSIFSLAAPVSIIGLHFLVMLCFINRWDEFVAVTLIPIWAWAGLGMILSIAAWFVLKNRLSVLTFLIWLVTGIFCADESPGLFRAVLSVFDRSSAGAAPADAPNRLRVVTVNCARGQIEAAQAVRALEPDIVFLQESPGEEKDLEDLTRELFGEQGSYLTAGGCAILGRGNLDDPQTVNDVQGVAATFKFAGGQTIDLLNLHLKRAIPRKDFWNPDCWNVLTEIRKQNRRSLRNLLDKMPRHLLTRPQIVAGDFGTPANDDIYRMLRSGGYTDSFRKIGMGWGNTYNRTKPLIRIDQIWCSGRLTPARSRVVVNEHSDHRMVVSDFILEKPEGALAAR